MIYFITINLFCCTSSLYLNYFELLSLFFYVHGAMDCGQKTPFTNVAVPPALSGFLAKSHLLRVSRQSLLSDNDQENFSIETVYEDCASNGVPLQNEVGSNAQHVRKRGERKQGKDGVCQKCLKGKKIILLIWVIINNMKINLLNIVPVNK